MVNLYWSQTDPTKGWWVASFRDADMIRMRKVLRDTQHDSTPEQIIEAAGSVIPEVSTWYRATGANGQLIGWTGEREVEA